MAAIEKMYQKKKGMWSTDNEIDAHGLVGVWQGVGVLLTVRGTTGLLLE